MKKLSHKWIGPYVVSNVCSSLTYSIVERSTGNPAGTHNVKNLKRF